VTSTRPYRNQTSSKVTTRSTSKTVGNWEAIRLSGATSTKVKKTLLERIEKLIRATKFAREEANMIPAPPVTVGEKIFGWLYRDTI
jgi:hypothetical protein